MMSLVDYASSDDEEPAAQNPAGPQQQKKDESKSPTTFGPHPAPPGPSNPLHVHNNRSVGPSPKPMGTVPSQSSTLKLPDASFLLNSPAVPSSAFNASDHSSRVAAAMAESAARKRELNGSPATYPRSKVPKGTLPHSRRVPETIDGRLLPPQLAGRSNVVTEDISRLFVRKHSDSPT